MGGKTGGWFDGAGSTDGEKDSAVIESGKDFVEMKWGFAEPADVRADFSATRAPGNFCRGFVEVGVVERRTGAGIAAAFEELAMHVEDAAGTRLFVEIVDVLGAEKKAILEGLF